MATLMQRLGRIKQRFAPAAQHYEITVATDPEGQSVTAITRVKRIWPGSAAAHPGLPAQHLGRAMAAHRWPVTPVKSAALRGLARVIVAY